MKVYVVSKGEYLNSEEQWTRNKNHAMEFVSNYGHSYALNHALRWAERARLSRNRKDATPIRFLDDPVPAIR